MEEDGDLEAAVNAFLQIKISYEVVFGVLLNEVQED